VALQGLGLGRALVGEGLQGAVEEAVGAAQVALPVPLQNPLLPRLPGRHVGGLPIHPHLGGVLHGLDDGGSGGAGHDGHVPPKVGHGPGVVQVGVGEEEGEDPLPVQLPRQEALPFSLREEEGVLGVVPVEAPDGGKEPEEEEVPKAQGGAGGEELREELPPAGEGLAEVQEHRPLPRLQKDLVAPDLPPSPKEGEAEGV
jgi:hypothetical protein